MMLSKDAGKDIVEILSKLFPMGAGLHEPWFRGREIELVTECIQSTYVSSVGRFVNRFEEAIQNYTGSNFAVAVVNGTSALHIALLLSGVKPNDEVLIPGLTFVATVNAALYCGGVPHFVDVDATYMGVDANKLESYLEETAEVRQGACWNRKTGRIIRSLIPMHTFGVPVYMDPLMELARRWKLQVVEDAAESLGSFYKGQHTGTIAELGVLSFNGNKIITAGGGGIILTRDSHLAARARHLTTTAKVPHAWEFVHDELGFNYRMPNLNAALAFAQLENLPIFLNNKRDLANQYREAFRSVTSVRLVSEPEYGKSNYWLNALVLDSPSRESRDHIIQSCHARKILVRPAWQLMPDLKFLSDYPKMDLSQAQRLVDSIICLPSSAFLCSERKQT